MFELFEAFKGDAKVFVLGVLKDESSPALFMLSMRAFVATISKSLLVAFCVSIVGKFRDLRLGTAPLYKYLSIFEGL